MTPATVAAMLERFAENARQAAAYVRRLSGDAFRAAVRPVVVEGVKAAVRIGGI